MSELVKPEKGINVSEGLYRFGYLQDGNTYKTAHTESLDQPYSDSQGLISEELVYISTELPGTFGKQDLVRMIELGYVVLPGGYCVDVYKRKEAGE